MKSNDSFFIGLTGCIGSGKSQVTDIIKSLGFPVVDADELAREVVRPNTSGLNEIIQAFGEEYLSADGTLDRKKMGIYVFDHPEALTVLNDIIHPKIRTEMLSQFKALSVSNRIVFADIPLLIESDLMVYFDQIWVVYAPYDVCLARIIDRDGIDEIFARKKLDAQMHIEKKLKFADVIIENTGTLDDLKEIVNKEIEQFFQHIE